MRPPCVARLAHQRRPRGHRGLDAAFGRHFVAHEAERRSIARLHVGHHAHAVHAADDVIARCRSRSLRHDGRGRRRRRSQRPCAGCSTATHCAVEPHLGPVIGRRVEVLGRGAVDVRRPQDGVGQAVDVAAIWRQFLEQVVERLAVVGGDRDRQPGGVVVGAANVEALNLVVAPCSTMVVRMACRSPESIR